MTQTKGFERVGVAAKALIQMMNIWLRDLPPENYVPLWDAAETLERALDWPTEEEK